MALNPKNLELALEWNGKILPWGINDDFVLNEKNEFTDLISPELEWQKI
jgi:hypothetical protein